MNGVTPATLTVRPELLLVVCGVFAACCIGAAAALLSHFARVDARLRAMQTATASELVPWGWSSGAGRALRRFIPRPYRTALQRRLDRAGLADRGTPAGVVLVAAGLAAVASAAALDRSGRATAVALFPLTLCLVLVAIGIGLDRLASRRRRAVQRSLSATLDLLVLAMEAGPSLDAAIREVVAEWQSPASRELERALTLTQLGLSRGAAFQQVAETLDLESLRRLAMRINAAERLGNSLVLLLRAEAEEARRERRVAATRQVAQAPTKILIPTALLILPVTLIVLLGPALPQLLQMAAGR